MIKQYLKDLKMLEFLLSKLGKGKLIEIIRILQQIQNSIVNNKCGNLHKNNNLCTYFD